MKLILFCDSGSRWAIRNLTYNITDYPKKLEVGKINEAIRLAFNQWARISDFTFTKVNGDAHISIGFKLHPKKFPNLAGTAKYPVCRFLVPNLNFKDFPILLL